MTNVREFDVALQVDSTKFVHDAGSFSNFRWHVNALMLTYSDFNPNIMIIMMTVEIKYVFNLKYKYK